MINITLKQIKYNEWRGYNNFLFASLYEDFAPIVLITRRTGYTLVYRGNLLQISIFGMWNSPQHLHAQDASPATGAAADKRSNFWANYWHFAKHFRPRISDGLNEHRGIIRSFADAATLRAWRRCCTIFRVSAGCRLFRIWLQFIIRDYWFTIVRVSGQMKHYRFLLRLRVWLWPSIVILFICWQLLQVLLIYYIIIM